MSEISIRNGSPLREPKRTVYYFTRMLPAYRIPVLELLDERLAGRLVVCHGQRPEGNPVLMGDGTVGFRRVDLRNYWWHGESVHAQPYWGVFERYGTPEAVIAEESPRSVTLPLLLRTVRNMGAARILWGIFYSVHRPYASKHPLQQYRLRMARQVEACLCYSERSRDVLAPHVKAERLFVAQNTLDTRTLFGLQRDLAAEGKSSVRKRLGLPDRPTFVFVGQLTPRKGTDDLLTFFDDIRHQRKSTLLVIGDGPERVAMEERVASRAMADEVHFLGSIPEFDRSAPYIFASDMMVLPGYVGLAINHAFCFGVPLLTQEAPGLSPFHGPEIESLVHGENGLMVPRTRSALVDGALRILENRVSFSENALAYARGRLSVDRLLDSVLAAINFAKSGLVQVEETSG